MQDKVVQRRVVPDEEVQLVRGQELNEILEREYPVEVNDPVGPVMNYLLIIIT